jgi:hypothetical protein
MTIHEKRSFRGGGKRANNQFLMGIFEGDSSCAMGLIRLLPLLALLIIPTKIAHAQVADVVSSDALGDYTSITVEGPRGGYIQRYWLVVDQDPRGLWCRDDKGRALMALRRGSVIETASKSASPLTFRQTKPYLQVRIQPFDLLYDVRQRDRGKATSCVVRANSSFLAPILPDSLERLQLKP